MSEKNKEQKRSKVVPARFGENAARFSSYNPAQRERIITQMNTIGTKQEMRNFESSVRDPNTGMMNTP